jgi:hypothetical protein
MRRNQNHLEGREEQSPLNRHHGYSSSYHPNVASDEHRRNSYAADMIPARNSPHHSTSSSGSVYMPPQSPQHMHTTTLPSPASLNCATPHSLPSISPSTTTSIQPLAQSGNQQDLQHQISVKTLEVQTLQRKYDNILQELEQQKARCATLEKNVEVSHVENISLANGKEKLQTQLVTIEGQVEELQQSRDEARRQLVANGAQYMRIIEMANRLQFQSSENKRRWEGERTELEQRIRLLEEAMVTGTEQPTPTPTPDAEHQSNIGPVPTATSLSSQAERINVLRAEVHRLRFRIQTLETALQDMRRESVSIQTAAQQLVESDGRLEAIAQSAVGTGG